MSRVTSDVTSLQELLTSGFLTIIGDIVGIAISVGFLLYFDVQLALVTFTVVPVLVVTMAVWQSYSRRAFIRVRQAIAVVNANLQENVSGVRVIQSLSREDENAKRFDDINQQNLRANVDAGRLTAAVMPMVEVIVALGDGAGRSATAATACCTAHMTGGGARRASRCSSSSSSTRCATSCCSTRSCSARWPAASASSRCWTRSRRSRTRPTPSTSTTSRGGSTSTTSTFRYVDDVPVLRDIDLHVEPGETIALVGQTGAGKTTITALLSRFYDVTDGSIEIDGIDVRQITHDSLVAPHGRRAAGAVPVLRHRRREHPLRAPRRDRRRDRGGGADRRRARLHQAAGRRLRHVPARARHEPLASASAS